MNQFNSDEIEFLEAALANKNVNVASDGKISHDKIKDKASMGEALYKVFSWIFFIISFIPVVISGFLLTIYIRLRNQIGDDTIQWVETTEISSYLDLIDPGSEEGAALDTVISFYNNLPNIIGMISGIAVVLLLCGIFTAAFYQSRRDKRLIAGSKSEDEEEKPQS